MRFFTRPIGFTTGMLLFVCIAQFTSIQAIAITVGVTYGCFIAAIAIHEAGHVFFAKIGGYQVERVTFGPLTVESKGILWNEEWRLFTGRTIFQTRVQHMDDLLRKHRLYCLGGPIFSYVGMLLCYVFAFLLDEPYLNVFALLNLMLLVVTAVPFKRQAYNDGRLFLLLKAGGSDAEEVVQHLLDNPKEQLVTESLTKSKDY